LYEERQYKITLDYLGFPILSGAIFAIILALILDYIPYPVYSLLVTSVVVISSIFLVKRKDKKDNYELRIMDVNEPRHN
jgi:hypothetical protein